tara:strand:- start:647 stop:1033 length:387 start_codon:yes stop_codon:yes gene_type:complete
MAKPEDFTLYCPNVRAGYQFVFKYLKSNEELTSWFQQKYQRRTKPHYDDYTLWTSKYNLVYVDEDKYIFSDPENDQGRFELDRKTLVMNATSCRLVTDEKADYYIDKWKQEQKQHRSKYPKIERKNKI